VTLTGTVDWQYQRQAVEISARKIGGVVRVSTQIALRPTVSPDEVRRKIEQAFQAQRGVRDVSRHYRGYRR
jgi:hypothetical protein